MATLSFTDFRGGLSVQSNRGARGAFYGGYGLDIRNGDNTLKCNQALKKDYAPTDLILSGFRASDGNQYAFGDTGKIYKKTAGVWSVVYTDTGKISGAYEFIHNDGAGNYIPYLVWATKTKLMQTKLSDTGFTGVVTIGTFALGIEPHTMRMAAGMLMVCDGNYIALLDYQGAYNSQGLNIAGGNNANALYERNDEVVIGTTGDKGAWLFTWNGSALSWILKRPAQGSAVNALIPLELGMLLQAGNEGYLRYWNYADVSPLTRVTNQGNACSSTYPGAVVEYHTIPYIGMNGGARNGVYSIGRLDKNDVMALNLEYIPSHGKLTGTEIGAMWRDGNDLYVSWKDGTAYGIDIIDHTTKATAVWESLENDARRADLEKVVHSIKILAKSAVPTGCSAGVRVRASRDTDWVDLDSEDGGTSIVAGETKRIFNAENMGEVFAIQITLTPNGNTTPEIAGVFASFDMDNDL